MTVKNLNFKLDKKPLKKTVEGFLKVDAYVTRTGLFEYPETNTIEYKPKKEVLNPDSLETMKGKSVTFFAHDKLLDINDYKKHEVGVIGENIRTEKKEDGESYILTNFLIKDKDVIEYIEKKYNSGQDIQLSMGYESDDVIEEGEYKGSKYDLKQTNLRYNHAAIVYKGRAGDQVKIKLNGKITQTGDAKMTVENKTNEESLKELGVVTQKLDDAQASISEQQKKLDALQTEKDELKGQYDAIQKERDDLKVKLDAIEIEKEVAELKPIAEKAEVKLDGLKTPKEIKLAVIQKLDRVDMKGSTDGEINGYFKAVAKSVNEKIKLDANKSIIAPIVSNEKKDSEQMKKDSCEEKMKDKWRNK